MVAVKAVVICVARFAVTDCQGVDKSRVFGSRCVIAPRPAGFVAGIAILATICRTSMVPARRYPGTGSMALIAGKRSRHMPGMFCFRGSSIVAGDALPRHCRAVVVTRAQPGRSVEVTAFAWRVGHEMSVGFWRRYDALADCMASVAVPRCAFEHAAHMASFTSCRGVPAS